MNEPTITYWDSTGAPYAPGSTEHPGNWFHWTTPPVWLPPRPAGMTDEQWDAFVKEQLAREKEFNRLARVARIATHEEAQRLARRAKSKAQRTARKISRRH